MSSGMPVLRKLAGMSFAVLGTKIVGGRMERNRARR